MKITTTKKSTQKPWSPILYWSITPEHKAYPGVWFMSSVLLCWWRLIFPRPAAITWKHLLSKGWAFVIPPHAEILSVLAYGYSTVSSYMYQPYCIWKMLFLWSFSLPLAPTIFLPALLHKSMSFWGEECDEDIRFFVLFYLFSSIF